MTQGLFGQLRKKISQKKAVIGVVGLGYVGLPLAIEFAKKGLAVVGTETDVGRLGSLQKRQSYITDVPTKELRRAMRQGTLRAVGDFQTLGSADVVIICVPTPRCAPG